MVQLPEIVDVLQFPIGVLKATPANVMAVKEVGVTIQVPTLVKVEQTPKIPPLNTAEVTVAETALPPTTFGTSVSLTVQFKVAEPLVIVTGPTKVIVPVGGLNE